MASWSEVHELAAKLKTTQEKTSVQKLSERTWVDIVRQLLAMNRVNLIFTSDGRSYLTQTELEKEIREELEAHNGRITLTELASCLDIEQSTLESKISEMISTDDDPVSRLISIPGEVITDSYLRQVAQDIRSRLEERGRTTLGELATIFSLPTTVILSVLQRNQSILFKLHKYGDEYVTDDFLSLVKAKVRGFFIPLFHPMSLSSAASRLKIPEGLLSSIISNLVNDGQLCGSLAGGRNTYIPWCYTDEETAYVRTFYNQNGYVEWDQLKRLGIFGQQQQFRSLLPDAIHLASVSVGPMVVNQLHATIEEAAKENTWVDLTNCFPPGVSPKDRMTLINRAQGKYDMKSVEDGLYLVSTDFLLKCLTYYDKLLRDRAEIAIKSRPAMSSTGHHDNFTEDTPAKHASHQVKGGFGMGAREIRTKNVKKKYVVGKRKQQIEDSLSGDREHSNDIGSEKLESTFSTYVSHDDLVDVLTSQLSSDVPMPVVSGVVDLIYHQLSREFAKLLNSVVLPNSDAARNKELALRTQEAVNNMLFSIQLMERGASAINRLSLQKQLLRHLVKSQGTCIVDMLCAYLAEYYGFSWPNDAADSTSRATEFTVPLSVDHRNRMVDLLRKLGSTEGNQVATKLNKILDLLRRIQTSDFSMDEYYMSLESLAAEQLGLNLGVLHVRMDNKRKKEERNKANELAVQTELQLDQAVQSFHDSNEMQHAATAALAATCIFSQVVTGWPVSAPGKLVPELVEWLAEASHQSTSGSPAVGLLKSSKVLEKLKQVTNWISQYMHSNTGVPVDSELQTALMAIAETAKSCRKTLYT